MSRLTRILIVVPVLNEAAVLPEFLAEIAGLGRELADRCAVRLLLIDDGSSDGTLPLLRAAAAASPGSVSYLSFTANAGHQAALIAGLVQAGDWPDAIVTMDADLEHPVSIVPRLIEAWQGSGAILVNAIRRETKELPWLKRLPSALFYRVTAALTGLRLIPGQADFRLWDAATVRGVRDYLPHIGSLRVFAAWLPGRKESIEYEQRVRADRRSRFTFRKNYELAAISIIRFSHVPLKAITLIGLLGMAFAVIYGTFIALAAARGETVPGWSSTVLTVMAMGCLQLVAFGVLASYLRRLVFARDLPPYVVREASLPAVSDTH
jgi:glycosyltransferase involved in cell wall biosynthesis